LCYDLLRFSLCSEICAMLECDCIVRNCVSYYFALDIANSLPPHCICNSHSAALAVNERIYTHNNT
jgi:hypothetical protein